MSVEESQHALPRVAITFCTQCRWMLRAAYFGQELLSTFGTTIGEVSLIPATGGIFTIDLTYATESDPAAADAQGIELQQVRIWDRKADGGFPETKVLKQLIRNHIDPSKSLGHSDTPGKASSTPDKAQPAESQVECKDCIMPDKTEDPAPV